MGERPGCASAAAEPTSSAAAEAGLAPGPRWSVGRTGLRSGSLRRLTQGWVGIGHAVAAVEDRT